MGGQCEAGICEQETVIGVKVYGDREEACGMCKRMVRVDLYYCANCKVHFCAACLTGAPKLLAAHASHRLFSLPQSLTPWAKSQL
jgi:hypothetical protein